MYPSGYYKTSYQALRLRETIRRWGFVRGIRFFLRTRHMGAGGGTWMPGLWSELECEPEDLSEEFWLATKPHCGDFEKLGFIRCRIAKTKTLNPQIRDSGGIGFLDSTRCYFGQVNFIRIFRRARGAETNEIIISFTAVFEDGGSFSCTNHQQIFDSVGNSKIVRVDSYDVNVIYQRFLEGLQQRKESPRRFPDTESLRQWFDARQMKEFEERVHRGLFVRMTDQEVAVAQTLQGRAAAVTPVFPRGFGWKWALWVVIIGCIVVFHFTRNQMPHVPRGRPDTIEYQGQEFKMRKAYPSYEDYKDDPNNLDTNELDRIEQTIVSAKEPESFANRKEFIDFLIFQLQFPGYGMGGNGDFPKADDGTRLEVETVEIPQKEKDRVLTLKQSGEQLILVDDFVYSTATNQIAHVKLKDKVLHYYDADNQLIREKQL
jgi:hypothetical protein